jgi:hypothetical protein
MGVSNGMLICRLHHGLVSSLEISSRQEERIGSATGIVFHTR